MIAKINSLQSLGASDGPGIRYVVFMQGCNLRCGCCHNPETWDMTGGTDMTSDQVFEKILRYKPYFGEHGGITVSGGEALLQAKFVAELFTLAKKSKKNKIHTCLDTAGHIMNSNVTELLNVTDHVLLDIKYCTEEDYQKYVRCSLKKVLEFLEILGEKNIKTTLRTVIIPTKNDNEKMIEFLNMLKQKHKNVDKIELLPFSNVCITKYENMDTQFPFKDIPVPTKEKMEELRRLVN